MSLPRRAPGAINHRARTCACTCACACARTRAVLVLLSGATLSSCGVLLGDNVKGSFACSAPEGTCAPSTLIDDQALATIESARPMSPVSHRLTVRSEPKGQAGALRSARGGGRSGRSAGLARVGDTLAHRDARTLRLVFPAFVDDAGNLHEARVVHAIVDQGGWVELTEGSLAPPVGYDAGDGEALPVLPAPHVPQPSVRVQSTADAFQEKPVSSARSQSSPPNKPLTIEAIRAQVAEQLTARPKPTQPDTQAQVAGSLQPITPHSPPEDGPERAAPVSATPELPVTATAPGSFSGPEGE